MISVVLPTFNRANTLMRAVESVLNQSYKNIELIVVDDCSTDNSLELLSKIDDTRLKIVQLDENKGANFCRNLGIEISNGDYIAFQDSDDYWLPDKLIKQLSYLIDYDCDVIASDMIVIDEDNQNIMRAISNEKKQGIVKFEDLLFENYISTQMVLAKRNVFSIEKFNIQLSRFQDWELFLRLSKEFNFYFVEEKLLIQYIQCDSVSKNLIKGIDALKQIDLLYKSDLEKNPAAYSHHNYILGVWSKHANKDHVKYFYDSIRLKFSWQAFLKMFASIIKLY
ncbi:glycosyltransferase family 2 protein [Enterococcus casseliflavus]|uniref:glycosyltransferase family 2 protein n=1 Tax=Enterococcus casseliflavus TaxID=37734 RepID=UPI0022A65EA5|nr:glycosyltransferase [Enterococcus casseliflavus]